MMEGGALLLGAVVFPLWVAMGLADWACHRATRIEVTSGWRENLFHWLLFAQMGLGIAAVVLFEVNGAVLLFGAIVFLAHELTVWAELRYTVPRRKVRPIEQMVHSFMELLPLVSLAVLAAMAWDKLDEFGLRWQPLPVRYLLAGGAAVLLLNVLPLLEEAWRCWGARRATQPTNRTPPPPAPR
jgi:hypothetical protein